MLRHAEDPDGVFFLGLFVKPECHIFRSTLSIELIHFRENYENCPMDH